MLLVEGHSCDVVYTDVQAALTDADVQVRLFGKPEVAGERRMGVVLALGDDTGHARRKATAAAARIGFELR